MKKALLTYLLTQLFFANLFAIDTLRVKTLSHNHHRSFYIGKQLNVYKHIPSNLSLWSNGDFSSINFRGDFKKGSYKLVDEFKKDTKWMFFSESVQSFKESGWRFYGNFSYATSQHDDADWNLGYAKSEVGNPFRLLIQRTGDFNVRQYTLKGIVNKTLHPKFSLGVGAKYVGNLYFRMSDTRNNFYNLSMLLNVSGTYRFSNQKSLSLGVELNRKKAHPSFSNEFKTNGPEFYMYFNEGLGDFNEIQLSTDIYYNSVYPRFTMGYFVEEKNKFNIQYGFQAAKESWNYRIASVTSPTAETLYEYKYIKNDILASYLINNLYTQFFNFVNIDYISGAGYRNQSVAFQKTYIYDMINVGLGSEINRPNSSLFYLSEVKADFEYVNKKDMIYGQRINYGNLLLSAKTGYKLSLRKNGSISIDGIFGYKHNVTFTHELGAATGKYYTKNLAYNEVAYHSSNYIEFGGRASWNKTFKKFNTEFFFKIKHQQPTKIKLSNSYSVLLDNDNRNYFNTGINIYF